MTTRENVRHVGPIERLFVDALLNAGLDAEGPHSALIGNLRTLVGLMDKQGEGRPLAVLPVSPICLIIDQVFRALAASNRLVAQVTAERYLLKEALRPFAEYARGLPPVVDGVSRDIDDRGVSLLGSFGGVYYTITFGDLRRARAALEEADHAHAPGESPSSVRDIADNAPQESAQAPGRKAEETGASSLPSGRPK